MKDGTFSWKELYDFCLRCGNVHDPKQFAIQIMTGLREYCNYDKGLVYFFDSNGKVYDQYLYNTDARWSTLYLEYYSKMPEDQRYSIYAPRRDIPNSSQVNLISWNSEKSEEFVRNFIQPRGLTYSLSYFLYDMNGYLRVLTSLDKISNPCFLPSEIEFVKLAVSQFDNLYKNFFSYQMRGKDIDQIDWASTKLTPREVEVANLLCKGMSPKHICSTLCVTRATVQKHISGIYAKLHVSSQRELLARLLG